MLLLLPLLFEGILCHGPGTKAAHILGLHHPAAAEPPAFYLLQTSSFANHSWQHTQSSAWVGELQTHRWDNDMGTIVFLRPWSQGNFSKEELKNLQALLQLYFHSFPSQVQELSSQFQLKYPFEIQVLSGCRLHPGKASESFLNAAYQGSDFLSFQDNSWKPSPGAGSLAQNVCKLLNHYRVIKEIMKRILRDTCPQFLAGLLEAGKSELERQVKPEAWVSKGPSPGPGRLLLVCHVSGFFPKSVWVRWMRGQLELPGTQQGEVLPNADTTWYLRVTLNVAAGEATGLTCRVKHSSLRGHDIIIHWDGYPIFLILICLAVLLTLVMLVVADSWIKKQSSNVNICSLHGSALPFPQKPTSKKPGI
ncbi:LOW QUALITY PROTEIN: T-cell surface glycoprotein CD1e, membrane-associated-like [Molossus nigricans]